MNEENKDELETKKVESTTETKQKKKGNKKTAIIAIVVIVILIIAVVGGFFGYQYVESNKSVGTTWGDTYYAYFKQIKDQTPEQRKQGYNIAEDMENIQIQFYQESEDTDPYMIMTYTRQEEPYTAIYYMKNQAVANICYNSSQLELLYNIENQQYDWYIHQKIGTDHIYQSIQNTITSEDYFTNEYTRFKPEEIESKTEVAEGEIPTISKFDQTFIKIETDEIQKIDIDFNASDKEFKKNFTTAVEEEKTKEEVITEEVKNQTESKVDDLERKKQEIKELEEEKARQEEEARKAEEERKAAEEAAKGIQAGNYTLKYGTYKGTDAQYDVGGILTTEITLTLKQDGTYTLKSSDSSVVSNSSGTYKIEKNTYAGISGTHILSLSSGSFYIITANNTLEVPAGSGATFTYQGY